MPLWHSSRKDYRKACKVPGTTDREGPTRIAPAVYVARVKDGRIRNDVGQDVYRAENCSGHRNFEEGGHISIWRPYLESAGSSHN